MPLCFFTSRCFRARHRDSGFSFLETVLSLLVGLPLLLVLLRSIAVSAELYLQATTARTEIEALYTVKNLLGAMVEHTGSHRLPVEPRIHPLGRLTFVDGVSHPVMTHPLYRPDSESNALSTLELDVEAALSVIAFLPDGSRQVCSRWGPLPASDIRLFVAFSVDGATPIEGSLHRIAGRPGCFTLSPNPTTSTVIASVPRLVPSATVFVPVRREYTVYLTAGGELRYLGHRGAITTENQPLLRGMRQLTITRESPLSPLPPRYRAALELPSGRRWAVSLSAPAAPRKLLTFLGVRP